MANGFCSKIKPKEIAMLLMISFFLQTNTAIFPNIAITQARLTEGVPIGKYDKKTKQ